MVNASLTIARYKQVPPVVARHIMIRVGDLYQKSNFLQFPGVHVSTFSIPFIKYPEVAVNLTNRTLTVRPRYFTRI